MQQIFKPFHTTKEDGMGMGLSINRSIIQAHHGGLWAENNFNQGATFFFTLLIAKEDSNNA
jgi:two-component system sensor kinase FixL